MTAIIMRGDAGNLLLPDESVDLIVTSPPYFGLRSYTDGGQHYAEQIGAEATPAEYLDALMACTAEWMRVLKPSGSIFVNLGDKYSTGNSGQSGMAKLGEQYRGGGHTQDKAKVRTGRVQGMPAKTLIGLPWRYAIRCIDELGLILRSEIIWAKPNGLPESVTDRVRRSHEQVFHFTKAQRYYSAVDHIREQYVAFRPGGVANGTQRIAAERQSVNVDYGGIRPEQNALGKLPGSVWSIPTSPLRVPAELEVDHFAAYPPELVRRIVLGWSPRDVCTACGEGRRPVVLKSEPVVVNGSHKAAAITSKYGNGQRHGTHGSTLGHERTATITGYACGCPDTSFRSTAGVVLDPFGGTGTTALVASVHGRVGLSNDLSDDYCRIARWRTTDPKQRAKAAGVLHKPPRVKPQTEELPGAEHVPGQMDLLGGVA